MCSYTCVGLARIVYINIHTVLARTMYVYMYICIYGVVCRIFFKQTVIHIVYLQLWPTLHK